MGKILAYVGLPLALLFAFDLMVAVAYVVFGWTWVSLPQIPLGIFGGAIGVSWVFEIQAATRDGGKHVRSGAR